jgi:hypothetical protein
MLPGILNTTAAEAVPAGHATAGRGGAEGSGK